MWRSLKFDIKRCRKKGANTEKKHTDSRTDSISKLESLLVNMDVSTNYYEVISICNGARDVFDRQPYDWQIEVWEAMLGKKQDVIVIAGTGSGKSLVFFCLHFVRPGAVTLVISPLLALIMDQVPCLIFYRLSKKLPDLDANFEGSRNQMRKRFWGQ